MIHATWTGTSSALYSKRNHALADKIPLIDDDADGRSRTGTAFATTPSR